MDTSKWIEALRELIKLWPVLLLASAALLYLPTTFLDPLGIISFVDEYRSWIGIVFLLTLCFAAVNWSKPLLSRIRTSLYHKANLKRKLRSLTPEEKSVLAVALLRDSRTFYAELEDGVVQGLQSAQIIRQSSPMPDSNYHYAYNIESRVWKTLRRHPQLLGLSQKEIGCRPTLPAYIPPGFDFRKLDQGRK